MFSCTFALVYLFNCVLPIWCFKLKKSGSRREFVLEVDDGEFEITVSSCCCFFHNFGPGTAHVVPAQEDFDLHDKKSLCLKETELFDVKISVS